MKATVLNFKSKSPAETKKIGRSLARILDADWNDTVTLTGELGAGKTTFVKGVLTGLGAARSEKDVTSPTFVIIHQYDAPFYVNHIDWYRLPKVEGVDREMAEECFQEGISLIEWPERGKALLPKERFEVKIAYGPGQSRAIRIEAKGARCAAQLKKI